MSSISNNESFSSSNPSNISAIPNTDQLTHLNDYNLLLNYASSDSDTEETIHPTKLDTPPSRPKLLALSSETTITKSSDSDMEISDSDTSPNHLHPKEKPTGSDSTTAMPISSTDLLGPPFFTGLVPRTLRVPDQESDHTTSRDAGLANSNPQRSEGRRPFGGTENILYTPSATPTPPAYYNTTHNSILLEIPLPRNKTFAPIFDELRTFEQIRARLNAVITFAQLDIPFEIRERLAIEWRLLMSPHHAALLAFAAREVMNYHCADLIESFGNLVSLKWPTNSPASTKMNIEHYAIDLLR